MAARYQHVTDTIRQDVAKRVGGLIWMQPDGETVGPADRPEEGSADPN
jgi:hypothetical protein